MLSFSTIYFNCFLCLWQPLMWQSGEMDRHPATPMDRAPEGGGWRGRGDAHPAALGQCNSIILCMKRTLVTLLSITHLPLSCFLSFFPSLFLLLSYTLACSHMLTLWAMATAHDISTFYHHFNRRGRDTAKVVSIHHPRRQNESSLGPSAVSGQICSGYPLILTLVFLFPSPPLSFLVPLCLLHICSRRQKKPQTIIIWSG